MTTAHVTLTTDGLHNWPIGLISRCVSQNVSHSCAAGASKCYADHEFYETPEGCEREGTEEEELNLEEEEVGQDNQAPWLPDAVDRQAHEHSSPGMEAISMPAFRLSER